MIGHLLALLLLPSLAFSQAEETAELKNLGQCGLTTRYASSQIGDTCLQEATNVYLDEDVGISRRKGFAKYNTTAITDSKSVRGAWPFRANDGTDYLVVLSSRNMFQSDGDGTFTAISPAIAGGNLSATQDMDCAQCLGRLWCVNGSDTMFSWDGTSTGTISGAPTCQAVDCFRNRVVLGNCSGTLSQLRMSGELDGTSYTIPSSPVSTSPAVISLGGVNDGNRLQCIMGTYQDVLVMGKTDSTWGLYGFDRRDFAVREISREVGCVDNRSSREKQGSLYWLSKRGIEKMTGPSITRVSDPIRDLVDTIIVAGGNSRSVTDTTQTDFEAGTLAASGPGAAMSATITQNSVVSGTWSVTTSGLGPDWIQTDIDTTTGVTGFISNFDNGSLSGNTVWTTRSGNVYVDGNFTLSASTVSGGSASASLPSIASTGTWSFVLTSTVTGNALFRLYFMSSATDWLATNAYRVTLEPFVGRIILSSITVSGNAVSLATYNGAAFNDGSSHYIRISRASNGFMVVYLDGVQVLTATDTALNSSTYVLAVFQDSTAPITQIHADKIAVPYFYERQASTIYNTGFSTPTYGSYSVSMSSLTTSSVTFSVQSSTASDGGGFETLVAQTNDYKIVAAQRRYFRHHVYPSPPETTEVSSVTAIALRGGTTGYFISQCRNPASAITRWGLFQCNQTLNSGTLSYAVSIGTTCHAVTRATATWTAQTNNSVITVATASYIAYRTLFTIDSATQTPTVNDCTINWDEGTTRPSVSAEVYRDRYYLAYTSGTSGTVVNDSLLVLDSRDQWVLHDAPNCSSLGIYNRKLYCGDSGSNGRVYQMDIGQDDDGASFTSNIRTKDFDFGNPFQRKELKRMYFNLAGLPDQSFSISLTPSYTLDASTDTFALNQINLNEDYSRFLATKVPAILSNNVTGRWFNFSLSHTGTQGPWKIFGIRAIYSRLTED